MRLSFPDIRRDDFGYDARDQLVTETTNLPGLPTQIVQHDYDLAGNRTRPKRLEF